jgi:hypothetical protein
MAAWAGSADLSPYDRTAYPWIALGAGLLMLVVWLLLLTRLARVPTPPRQRRLDLRQMSGAEKRWTVALAAFTTGLIAWLNAAATVDWTPLAAALRTGQLAPVLFTVGLAVFLVTMVGGIRFSWRRAGSAYRQRVAEAS